MKPPLAGEEWPGYRRGDIASTFIVACQRGKENGTGTAEVHLIHSELGIRPAGLPAHVHEESAMSASTDIPLTITPEAAARIAELGMRKEFEQMIEHTRQVVPDLAAIEVTIAECYDTRDEPGVSIEAYSDQVFEPGDNTSEKVSRWAVNNFRPQVLEHLCILFNPGEPYGR